jgi:hypothetical protein
MLDLGPVLTPEEVRAATIARYEAELLDLYAKKERGEITYPYMKACEGRLKAQIYSEKNPLSPEELERRKRQCAEVRAFIPRRSKES